MLQDASDVSSRTLGADVCIIGAGPAGLTVAAELVAKGLDVVVLEAGGLPYDRHDRRNLGKALGDHLRGAQSLARGRVSGEPYYPLRLSRARGLAGSANALMSHGLRARPLDAVDFGPRFGSSWPISYDELLRHLPAAEVHAGVRSARDDQVSWAPQKLRLGNRGSDVLVVAPFRHGIRDHFPSEAARTDGSDRPRFITSSIVTGFRTGGSGTVKAVDVVSLRGASFRVEASVFVLATGGVDNARVLLSSWPLLYSMDASARLVGRNFMEHLHYVAGYLVPSSPDAAAEIAGVFGDPMHAAHWVTPADDIVLREDLLRVGVTAIPVQDESLHPAVPAAGELARIAPYGPYGPAARARQMGTALRGISHVGRALAVRVAGGVDRAVFGLAVMTEQIPHPDSRVSLTARRDRTGMLLPSLHWRVSDRDFTDARRSIELLGAEVERLGLGRLTSLWDRGAHRPDVVTGGWHHMGTTIMSAEPTMGVVDENCRVHGLANLYMAGSSVFPTSGYANPTLTLLTLAVRLAAHLSSSPP